MHYVQLLRYNRRRKTIEVSLREIIRSYAHRQRGRGRAKSLQLIAGRTGQEFNQRKERKGAFWEDRYHATAVEGNEHLIRCLIYVDLNMVRAGVVKHPVEWEMSGYNEIQNPPDRYGVIERQALQQLCGLRLGWASTVL